MNPALVMTDTVERTKLTALRKVIIVGLVGNVVVFACMQAITRTLIPPLAIILALTLVVAGVSATRWRWAGLLAAAWCVISTIPGLPPYAYNLSHPAETPTFIATVVGLALLSVALVAGLAATVSGDRRMAEERAPRWLPGFLIGETAFVLGAILIGMISSASATAGVSAETLAQLPALVTEHDKFSRGELRARVGETVAIRLENRDAERHYFDVDELNVHIPMPAGTAGLGLFTATKPGTYTFYCSVPGHREAGMVGTLIVEP